VNLSFAVSTFCQEIIKENICFKPGKILYRRENEY